MNRRKFVKTSAMAGMAASSIPGFGANMFSAEYDKYGGWTGKKFKATGFFRVEKEDRWWFVSPEGNAFLSFGINHLSPIFFNQEFNYRQWQKKLGVKDIADLKEFHRALRHWFLQTCKDFGFNTVGPHNARPIINNPKPEMAYVEQVKFVDIPHWKPEVPDENFKDIFSQEFKNEADYLAKKMVENKKDDPYLLGYYMTDCPLFTDEDCRERTDTIGGARRTSRIGWPRKLRNLDGAAAGKEAYVKTMQKIYEGRISKFNEAYETRFGSFDDLANAINWRPDNDLSNGNEVRDNIEFLKVCVEKYYQVARNSIRKYDENHLFFGDKINANSNTVDTVLPITEKYTDVIMYQMYGKYEVQEPGLNRWQKVTDKPFFNGDSSYTMITEDMHRPYGPIADNLEQRAEWTKEFMEKAFARPNFIGWHYCGLVDATFKNPQKRKRQHSGLIDQYGNPYPLLQKNIKTFTGKMYALARK